MKFNVIYTNNGPRTPSGATQNQTVAGLSSVGVYIQSVTPAASAPLYGNPDAAAVIKSNGESIGNAIPRKNPLPPGITS
jgi:hypothetical protein